MQKVIIAMVGVLAIMLASGCVSKQQANSAAGTKTSSMQRDSKISGYGQVRYVNLEGGFYGIIGENGEKYEPINLPSDLRKNRTEIKFWAKIRKDLSSTYMWGTPIEITDARATGK